jgi:Na+/melibiose symporter-like transporter
MAILGTTVMFVALPSIQRGLGMTVTGRQWIVTAYTIALAGFLLAGGRLADRLGARRTLLIGVAGGRNGRLGVRARRSLLARMEFGPDRRLAAAAAAALSAFAARQAGHPDRLLPLRVVLDRNRGWAMTGLIDSGFSTFGMMLILTCQLQSVMGCAALQTGLALIPFALAGAGSALVAPLLMVRIPPRWLIAASIVIEAGGLIPLIWLTPGSHYVPLILTATIIEGLGTGVAGPATLSTALAAVLPLTPAQQAPGPAPPASSAPPSAPPCSTPSPPPPPPATWQRTHPRPPPPAPSAASPSRWPGAPPSPSPPPSPSWLS